MNSVKSGTSLTLKGTLNRVDDLDQMEGNDTTQGIQIINLQGDRDRMQTSINDLEISVSSNHSEIIDHVKRITDLKQ